VEITSRTQKTLTTLSCFCTIVDVCAAIGNLAPLGIAKDLSADTGQVTAQGDGNLLEGMMLIEHDFNLISLR
jgi:hypothetical protein